MSPSKRARLTVRAEPGVSLTVLDAELKPVASALGTLDAQLPPGLYELQLVAGHAVTREVIRLSENGTTFQAPPVDFPSPAPLSPTGADDVIAQHAKTLSRRPGKRFGKGAELLIVVSDDAAAARANPAAGLSLRALDGTPITEIEEVAKQSRPGKQPLWAIACIALDPGAYRLRVATGGPTIEQTVVLTKSWQTQVFLDRKSWGPPPAKRRASLPDAAVLMARIGAGFDPSRRELRLAELVRVALLDSRAILIDSDIQKLVYGKWDNPMFGLYGANVLLATRSRQIRDLDVIRRNLRKLLGDHPDVTALDARAGMTVEPVTVPPMLRVSWDALVSASARQPELISADSLPGRISNQLFGNGVWLTWEVPKRQRKPRPEPTPRIRVADALEQLAAAIGDPAATPARGTRTKAGTTPARSAVGESVVALASEIARITTTKQARTKLSEREVVEMLGAPQAVVASALSDAIRDFT
jgi:hypothetical protein